MHSRFKQRIKTILMNDIEILIEGIARSPIILKNLASQIPEDFLKNRRVKGKWTIHEHIVHLAEAEKMIYQRFISFKRSIRPNFSNYSPDETVDVGNLMKRDLSQEIEDFDKHRKNTVDLVKTFTAEDWSKKATHQEYIEYSAYILLRHVLMHDNLHMYRCEELWLTTDKFLAKRQSHAAD